MKTTIGGKRYDTDNCELIASSDWHNNGNYAGQEDLLLASDGVMLTHGDSNGQDCYRSDYLCAWDRNESPIDNYDLTDEQEARAVELGLITVVS